MSWEKPTCHNDAPGPNNVFLGLRWSSGNGVSQLFLRSGHLWVFNWINTWPGMIVTDFEIFLPKTTLRGGWRSYNNTSLWLLVNRRRNIILEIDVFLIRSINRAIFYLSEISLIDFEKIQDLTTGMSFLYLFLYIFCLNVKCVILHWQILSIECCITNILFMYICNF